MTRGKILLGYALVTFSIIVFAATPMSSAADLPKVTWKFQLCCPPMSPAFVDTVGLKPTPESIRVAGVPSLAKELSRAVSARTNGRFKLKVFSAGELFKLGQAYEALEKGLIEMWHGPPWGFAGRNPFANVVGGLPYSITNRDQAYDIMYQTNFREIARRAYAKNNIYYISGTLGGALVIATNFPVYSMADLKGKKLKAGGVLARTLRALGGIDVKLGPAEIYTALQRGVIDGVIHPLVYLGEWGYLEFAKYVSLPPVFGEYTIDWACNLDAWNRLPKDYQVILQEEADGLWKWCLKVLLPHLERSEEYRWSQKGVKFITLSGEALSEMRKAVYPVWDDLAAMGPESAEGVKLIRNYLGIK